MDQRRKTDTASAAPVIGDLGVSPLWLFVQAIEHMLPPGPTSETDRSLGMVCCGDNSQDETMMITSHSQPGGKTALHLPIQHLVQEEVGVRRQRACGIQRNAISLGRSTPGYSGPIVGAFHTEAADRPSSVSLKLCLFQWKPILENIQNIPIIEIRSCSIYNEKRFIYIQVEKNVPTKALHARFQILSADIFESLGFLQDADTASRDILINGNIRLLVTKEIIKRMDGQRIGARLGTTKATRTLLYVCVTTGQCRDPIAFLPFYRVKRRRRGHTSLEEKPEMSMKKDFPTAMNALVELGESTRRSEQHRMKIHMS